MVSLRIRNVVEFRRYRLGRTRWVLKNVVPEGHRTQGLHYKSQKSLCKINYEEFHVEEYKYVRQFLQNSPLPLLSKFT